PVVPDPDRVVPRGVDGEDAVIGGGVIDDGLEVGVMDHGAVVLRSAGAGTVGLVCHSREPVLPRPEEEVVVARSTVIKDAVHGDRVAVTEVDREPVGAILGTNKDAVEGSHLESSQDGAVAQYLKRGAVAPFEADGKAVVSRCAGDEEISLHPL